VASVVRKSGNSLGRFTGFLLRAFDEMPYGPCNGGAFFHSRHYSALNSAMSARAQLGFILQGLGR